MKAKKASVPSKMVVDTNVILSNNSFFLDFKKTQFIIPSTVVEELDKHKTDDGIVGFNARKFIRILEAISAVGDIKKGIRIDNLNSIRVANIHDYKKLPALSVPLRELTNDDRIILIARLEKCLVLSKDANVRVKARSLGLKAENYEASDVEDKDRPYLGHSEMDISDDESDALRNDGEVVLQNKRDLADNEYVVAKNIKHHRLLCRFNKSANSLILIDENNDGFMSVRAKNQEQKFAMNALLDPNIQLVTIIGSAGCGKTLLCLAAGLRQTIGSKPTYSNVMIIRPIVPLGEEIGFLPGDVQEKMAPWTAPIQDNLGAIYKKTNTNPFEVLVESGHLVIEPMAFIRGRSIENSFIIIDESQNLTNAEIKAILTRAGVGTKIVLTGDVDQIDKRSLDKLNNGLAYVSRQFKNDPIAAHITLLKSERSALAEKASKLL